jgi:hypothetical protein
MTKDKVLRPRFKLVAVAEDEATGEFFAVIKYRWACAACDFAAR